MIVVHSGIVDFSLWKSNPISDSAYYVTTLYSTCNLVWSGTFSIGFLGRLKGSYYLDLKKITTHSALCFWFNKVRIITMKMQQHVTCFVSKNGIFVCHYIIEEMSDGIGCVLYCFGLFFCDDVECCEHSTVKNLRIVQQCPNNLMDL